MAVEDKDTLHSRIYNNALNYEWMERMDIKAFTIATNANVTDND